MAMLEDEKVIANFGLFDKRQMKIDSSQVKGNPSYAVGFRQHPSFGKPGDYTASENPPTFFPSLKICHGSEEGTRHLFGYDDH